MIDALLRTILGAGIIYLLLCLIVSGLNEWIAVTAGSRGRFLKIGIRRLLPDPPVFRRVMQHPLISGMNRDMVKVGRPPSYLSPVNFTGALLEVVSVRARLAGWKPSGRPMEDLKGSAEAIRLDHPLVAQALLSIFDRAGDDYDRAVAGTEAWFSSSMDRVRGWYVGFTRKRLFFLAFLIAIPANLDAVKVVRAFWNDTPTVQAAGTAEKPAEWPIGYACLRQAAGDVGERIGTCAGDFLSAEKGQAWWLRLLSSILGWLITATAVAIGTPYLYRVLTSFRR